MKKAIFFALFVFLNISLILAINLDVSEKPIINTLVTGLDKPAVFDLTIINLGETDTFKIYSVIGMDISPEEPFEIISGERKTIKITANPQETLKLQTGTRSFEYKIRDSKNEIQKEYLPMNVLALNELLTITPESINPGSEIATISIKNRATFDLDNLILKIDSAFFNYQSVIFLKALETTEIQIPINQEKAKTLKAGNYIANIEIELENKKATKETLIKFLEQEGIYIEEQKEGFIIKREEIIKKNVGNVNKNVKTTSEKNLISYLFTTVNIEPTQTSFQGFTIKNTWEKELIPNEELKVIVKTNWLYPIIIILLVILIVYLIKRSVETDLIVRKKVSFVNTKGGQFALKVTLKLKAKKYIERINLVDKLPSLVNLYSKFGAVSPTKIDLNNKRLEWNIESLNKDEERIFTYIIYSKIGVVGKFELPSAKATYEKDGIVKHQISNRSFYINEPKG